MRAVDVRNALGKAFCDYLLTGRQSYLEFIADFAGKNAVYDAAERFEFYLRFVRRNQALIPASDPSLVLFFTAELNNLGYPFEAHEVAEKYWLKYRGGRKDFILALIQVAIANLHLLNRNYKGYLKIKQKAAENLKPFGGNLWGIEVELLKEFLKREKNLFVPIPRPG